MEKWTQLVAKFFSCNNAFKIVQISSPLVLLLQLHILLFFSSTSATLHDTSLILRLVEYVECFTYGFYRSILKAKYIHEIQQVVLVEFSQL